MDIASAILFGAAIIWLVLQSFMECGEEGRGTGLVAILVLGGILAADWFYGRQHLLGNPPHGFWHTILKLVADFLLICFVGSGVTAVRRSKHIGFVVLNVLWASTLVAGLLKLMKVW
jgi:hypothetical protein